MRRLLIGAPWVVWAIHAAALACGLFAVGAVGFAPVGALVLWAVVEVPYLAVVDTMSKRAGATTGAAVHVGCMASLVMLLGLFGLLLPWFWTGALPLVVPTILK